MIKQLEWVQASDSAWYAAVPLRSDFWITVGHEGWVQASFLGYPGYWHERFDSVDDARAACQARFEMIVASMLKPE